MQVQPKKNLGQHFLKDHSIARRIADSLRGESCDSVLEVGPGMGILTGYLLDRGFPDFRVIEIDNESVHYLAAHFPGLEIIRGDFIALPPSDLLKGRTGIVGNFPYNISTQILFKVLENKDVIPEVAGMLQKEVAERICNGPGSKEYGILSVLLQAWYRTEYLFTVPEHVFSPPPKVKSGVIRLTRNDVRELGCNERLFTKVVKAAFNQRRKQLRNSIRSVFPLKRDDYPDFGMRPEQLTVQEFVDMTNWIDENRIQNE